MITYIAGRALGAALLIATAATAQAQLTVTPSGTSRPASAHDAATPTLATWSRHVFENLSDVTTYPRPVAGRPDNTGIVAVKFNCSESGAPENVVLYKSSGHRDLDHATLRGVRRIASLHPLPAGVSHHQGIIIRVLYARTEDGAKRLAAKMRADAARSNAWLGKNSTVTAALELAPIGQ